MGTPEHTGTGNTQTNDGNDISDDVNETNDK